VRLEELNEVGNLKAGAVSCYGRPARPIARSQLKNPITLCGLVIKAALLKNLLSQMALYILPSC
jgi:hypothetical protein